MTSPMQNSHSPYLPAWLRFLTDLHSYISSPRIYCSTVLHPNREPPIAYCPPPQTRMLGIALWETPPPPPPPISPPLTNQLFPPSQFLHDQTLLVCPLIHSHPQRPCLFWSAPRIVTSWKVQYQKSTIHRLPVTLHMLRVNSDKSAWLSTK